ncbi:hypothetical protein, partial [Serratia marcescens]|uniref:hypothetical protein n=1 Tax=Serratia marcescens TaxID=615 RepID=UPI001C37DE7D
MIDATGTHRRLGALMLQGHSLTAIQTATGVTALGRVLTRDQVTARVARLVRDYFDTHWTIRASSPTPAGERMIVRTIALATSRGYLPALAWDEDRIDDPSAAADVDCVRRPLPCGQFLHLEDVEFLATQG